MKSLIKKILKEEVHHLLKKHSFKLLNEWLLDECDQITHSDYPDSILFKRRSDGKIIAEIYNVKENEYFLLHYDEIWSFFEKHFELKYEEIREIARDWLDETFKLKGYTPESKIPIGRWSLDETFKLKGYTPSNSPRPWFTRLDETFKLRGCRPYPIKKINYVLWF